VADAIEVQDLRKTFGARTALRDVSFKAVAGEFVAILGPSGAGKTTLFRCMTGLQTADSGRVLFDGRQLRSIGRGAVAMVFQQFNLVQRSSVLENVLVGRLGAMPSWRVVARAFKKEERERAFVALERVGLADLAEQRADRLSGGQQQRVAIARALAQRSRYVFADEPIASLDPISSRAILRELRTIAREDGLAVLCSLHQVEFATEYADRIIGMFDGEIVADVRADMFDGGQFEAIYGPA
jgi:phosphonate transport system ATP-binding protein